MPRRIGNNTHYLYYSPFLTVWLLSCRFGFDQSWYFLKIPSWSNTTFRFVWQPHGSNYNVSQKGAYMSELCITSEMSACTSAAHQAQYTQMLSRLHSSHDAAAARRQTVASLLASYSTCFSRLELLADPLGEFWSLRNDPSNCWLTIHVQRLVHALQQAQVMEQRDKLACLVMFPRRPAGNSSHNCRQF